MEGLYIAAGCGWLWFLMSGLDDVKPPVVNVLWSEMSHQSFLVCAVHLCCMVAGGGRDPLCIPPHSLSVSKYL